MFLRYINEAFLYNLVFRDLRGAKPVVFSAFTSILCNDLHHQNMFF